MNILVVIQNCMQHHWPFYYSVPLYVCMSAKSLQSCPTLCNPMDCKPTRLLCSWDSPGKNTGVGCHALLQGIFQTQGLNPGLSCLLPRQAGSLPLAPLVHADPIFWKAMVALVLIPWNTFFIFCNALNSDDTCYISNTYTGDTAEVFQLPSRTMVCHSKGDTEQKYWQVCWSSKSLNCWCNHKHGTSWRYQANRCLDD